MNDTKRKPKSTAGPFDWNDIKQRLTRLQQTVAQSHKLSPEQARVVMDMRAQALAEVPAKAQDAQDAREFVTFNLAGERVAIETRFVREVYCPGEITRLPDSPDFLRGVTNLRGEVLAVVDLRTFFGIDASKERTVSEVLILGTDHPEFGILADEVHEVIVLSADRVFKSADRVGDAAGECVSGVTEDAMLILDGDALLKDSRLVIDQSD